MSRGLHTRVAFSHAQMKFSHAAPTSPLGACTLFLRPVAHDRHCRRPHSEHYITSFAISFSLRRAMGYYDSRSPSLCPSIDFPSFPFGILPLLANNIGATFVEGRQRASCVKLCGYLGRDMDR